MTPFSTLITAAGISLAASTLTVIAIHGPLQRLLNALCASEATSAFWTRAAVTVLYLLPLCMVLIFGVPDLTLISDSPAEIARRTVAAASLSLTAIVVAIGLRLAGTHRAQLTPPPRRYPEREGL